MHIYVNTSIHLYAHSIYIYIYIYTYIYIYVYIHMFCELKINGGEVRILNLYDKYTDIHMYIYKNI
jgi:hypothetical protein